MTVEAVCIGDELLDGRVRDANAAYLGAVLADRGRELDRVRVVRDGVADIVEALRETRAALVVVSGGLGPTTDDLTREAAATFAGSALRFDDEAMASIEARFAARGRELTENNRRQALFPSSARVLLSEVGTAPGFSLDHDGRAFFFFPGVPSEYRWFVQRQIAPRLDESGRERRTLLFHGLGESALEAKIADLADEATRAGVIVGYRAAYPVIEVKLSGPPDAVATARDAMAQRLAEWLVGEDDEGISARVGRLLLERGETVTTAESCTAGGIAALITDVSGSSSWFGRGYVTYANEAKVDEVGVLESVLLQHGAVSAQTVCQMASGARKRARATYGLAVSGIAGPGGGTPAKPVGTVHFALATKRGVYHRHVLYRLDDRALIRRGTAYAALQMLIALLEGRLAHVGAGPYAEADVWAPGGITSEQT